MSDYYDFKYFKNKSWKKRVIRLILFYLFLFVFIIFVLFLTITIMRTSGPSSFQNKNISNNNYTSFSSTNKGSQSSILNLDTDNLLTKTNSLKEGEFFSQKVIIQNEEYIKYIYKIKKEDTLWKISEFFYHDAYAWDEIVKHNRKIDNPHLIQRDDIIYIYIKIYNQDENLTQ